MGRRALQISSTIMRELQNRLARGLADPRIKGMITITKVETSDDLKHTKAYVSVMPEEHASITMHGLTSATKRIRRDVMQRMHIKEMPSLTFVYDEGNRQQRVIAELLAKDLIERGRGSGAQEPESPQTPDPGGAP